MNQKLYLFLIFVLIYLFGCSGNSIHEQKTKSEQPAKSQQSPIDYKSGSRTQKITATKSPPKRNAIMPSRLQIPAIHLDTEVEPVGILNNGQMGVPDSFHTVGILSPWTLAGEHGNAVIAGHFDHKTGPAVFYNLRNLKLGDKVIVSNKTGNTLTFKVKEVKAYKLPEAPLEKIFGKSDKSQLNLITCAGKYNKKTKEHAKRLVVFTELATAENQPSRAEWIKGTRNIPTEITP